MRQFLLAGNVAYATGADLNSVPAGAIGVFVNKNGIPTVSTNGTDVKKEAMLVLGRGVSEGGTVVLPLYPYHFSFVKGEYQAATTFSAKITVPAGDRIGDYTVIIAKKGLLFNDRNKWTAEYHNTDVSVTAAQIAEQLAKKINYNTVGSGVKAVANGADLTITATEKGKDYAIIPADLMMGLEVTDITSGSPAYGDVNYIKDLADKAAADAGFEYTYRDSYTYLYPNYPLNPLAQPDKEDTGFTVFTLRFAEPRDVKTRDEVVHQIVQVAFPKGAAGIAAFENVMNGIAGESAIRVASDDCK